MRSQEAEPSGSIGFGWCRTYAARLYMFKRHSKGFVAANFMPNNYGLN